jgi:hypothetical protein
MRSMAFSIDWFVFMPGWQVLTGLRADNTIR